VAARRKKIGKSRVIRQTIGFENVEDRGVKEMEMKIRK